ncbi:MAG TPA: type I DNA topoisomerase [Firmicutes bacterium]|nr:type I DNA topoisomerase [Bacillota bacterium]
MSRPLIIVESPAKARTIQKFLGKRFIVRATVGHIRDLPKSQFGVDIENGFAPKYINIRGKGDIIRELRETAKKATRVYLATDPDREGEAISWHLAQVLELDPQSPTRVEFHEVTKNVVEQAVKNPRQIDMKLVDAQQARRILDRIVGYQLSPFLWDKVKRGLSAGRVQSAALRLICDREDEIAAFQEEEYWTIDVVLRRSSDTFIATYYGESGKKRVIRNKEEVDAILNELRGAQFTVSSVNRRQRKRSAPAPFTTSTMQQEASKRLGFTVKKTMRLAQELYEGLELGEEGAVGLITYIRTDSIRVAEDVAAETRDYISDKYGAEYAKSVPHKQKGEFVQGAHEAIRPTSVRREPDSLKPYLSRDQLKLYTLIWERFVASLMSPAIYDTMSVRVEAGRHELRASGSKLVFAGFLNVYSDHESPTEQMLPELEEGDVLTLVELKEEQHFTEPPPRYTEASLVKSLEEKGIGRPSTYGPIIDTLKERDYVTLEDKRFVPTELGKLVVSILKAHFPTIVDIEFTAKMEEQLDEIEAGRAEKIGVLQAFYSQFKPQLDKAKETMPHVEAPIAVSDVKCEYCGRNMVVKHSRFGKFLACPGYPNCKNTKPYFEYADGTCPECGGRLVVRYSKRGRKFFGCERYPECKFISWKKPEPPTPKS